LDDTEDIHIDRRADDMAEKDQLGFFLLAAPIPLPYPILVFLLTVKMGMPVNFAIH
jgi:hypothetical protein